MTTQTTTNANGTETFDTIVIGGGQAGLAMGHALAERRRSFVILDAHARVGDAWRTRWDSLVLFTPARYLALPGLRFPAAGGDLVSKDAMADYLESYAEHFCLPVRTNTRVDGLTRRGDRFAVTAGDRTFEADNVVVAMANFQQPKVPTFAADLDPTIVQMHSYEYRNPSQLADGPALLVGVGNSGAEIALELSKGRPTTIAGKEAGTIPLPIDSRIGRHIGVRLVRFLGHHILTVDTRLGRKVRTHFITEATPLLRVKPKDLARAGIERVGRIAGVIDGRPATDEGEVLDVANVIWCTGWRPGFSWIDLPVLGDRQEPIHDRGVVTQEPGLYFIGLEFVYAATSATVTGVGRDAERVAKHIAERTPVDARVTEDAAAA